MKQIQLWLKSHHRPLFLSASIVGIFAILLLTLTIPLSIFSNPDSSSVPEQEKELKFDVTYTNEGYSPDTLEVPIGASVTFHNKSTLPMWTASDPHPVHSDFSPFDSLRDYVNGESYTYQFTAMGTFGYHNHTKSDHRGIVRVTDPNNPLPNIDKTKENQRAIRDKYMALLKPGQPNSVFAMIDSIEANYSLSRDCHDMAHDLGHRAYELYGFSSAMTFSNPARQGHTSIDDICAGGYMHGILEEVFLNQPKLKNQPADICSSIPQANRDSCFHGVGHGLMFVNERSVPNSLTDCRKLDPALDMLRCFEGVWMEMFWGEVGHGSSSSLGWSVEQPLAPCKNAKEDEKPACYIYAHLGFLRNNPKDFEGAIKLCTDNDLVLNDELFCIKGIGITMMKHFTSQRLVEAEKLVVGLSYLEKYAYYQGVIGYARLSGVKESSIEQFCNALQTDTKVCTDVMENET